MKFICFLILLLACISGCRDKKLPDYSDLSLEACDSLLATNLPVYDQVAVLLQTSKKGMIGVVVVSEKTQKKRERYINYMHKAIELAPNDVKRDVQIEAIGIYIKNLNMSCFAKDLQKRIEDLILELEKCELSTTQQIDYLLHKTNYFCTIGAYQEALRQQAMSMEILRQNKNEAGKAASFFFAACIYKNLEDDESCLSFCDSALQVTDFPFTQKEKNQVHLLRSMVYKRQKRYDKALEARLQMPSNIKKDITIAQLYTQAGKPEKALQLIKEYRENAFLLQNNPVLSTYEADALDALGDTTHANIIRGIAIQQVKAQRDSFLNLGKTGIIPRSFLPVISTQADRKWRSGHRKEALDLLCLMENLKMGSDESVLSRQPYIDLLTQMSYYYTLLGNHERALKIYQKRDSVVQKMESYNYGEKHRQIIAAHEAEMLNMELDKQQAKIKAIKNNQLFLRTFALVSTILVVLLLLFLRLRGRTIELLYRKQKEQEALALKVLEEKSMAPEEQLFKQIEETVINHQLFTNPGFTLEELSSFIDVNRSYVSTAINRCRKMNFNRWINSLRIKYMLDHLNEEDLDVLVSKAGFLSRKSFYSHFKEEVGISMNEYLKREKDATNSK